MSKVRYSSITLCQGLATAQLASFTPEGKTAEWHAIIHLDPDAEQKKETLLDAEQELLHVHLPEAGICARRILAEEPAGLQFAIGQKPLDGSGLAEWLYLKNCSDEHNGYAHYFDLALTDPEAAGPHESSSAAQTKCILESYESMLSDRKLTMERDCIRTWFFVGDIDNNYAGLVTARKENFLGQGLNEKTHYISSTGICGSSYAPKALVQMDAYSIKGLDDGQVSFLKALSNMNPTYEYGVTFERGTLVRYGDRNHIIVSGTASIDTKGNVLHIGNVAAQTLRMWENVDAVLSEGGCSFDDLVHILVYLRNESDYDTVRRMFEEKFPTTPYVIVLAPVCRPDWLIEMECMAVTPAHNSSFRNL